MTDTTIDVDVLRIANSSIHIGSVICWSIENSYSWLIIGYFGLSFQHWEDKDSMPKVKNPSHIYNIIGEDLI